MLQLQDLIQSPLFAQYSQELLSWSAGLVLITGMEARPPLGAPIHAPALVVNGRLLPGGRGVVFRSIIEGFLTANPTSGCLMVTPEKIPTISRHFYRRIRVINVETPLEQASQIAAAAAIRPALVAVDRLEGAGIQAALDAACQGVRVVANMESPFHGAVLAQHLLDLGATKESLNGIQWLVALARVATLCLACRMPVEPLPGQIADLQSLADRLGLTWQALCQGQTPIFYDSPGCPRCQNTGRSQDVAVVDLFHPDPQTGPVTHQTSCLPLEKCLLSLAAQGKLALADVVEFNLSRARVIYHLYNTAEQARLAGETGLGVKLAQLESANRVLEQRTQAVFSFQDIGQALISSANLYDLAAKVCQRASQLCRAEHAVLYYRHAGEKMEITAVCGWEPALIRNQLAEERVLGLSRSVEPAAFHALPPGIPDDQVVDPLKGLPRAGLYVALHAQGECVGAMIIHTNRKTGFSPGEIAMLKAFANQAALALQRADLVQDLQRKIDELEAAQEELALKERIEREMELARQVQQSMLPQTFPEVPGCAFSATNIPARQVGGDFYDVFLLDSWRVGVVIADVSGKGMPAALNMALTRSLLRAEARRALSPKIVLVAVNELLQDLGGAGFFVTIFYGIYDIQTRRLTFARAGHDRPVLLQRGSLAELDSLGAAIGIFAPEEYHLGEEEIFLVPGDRLVLYTDGLVDVVDAQGNHFGLEHLRQTLKALADLPGRSFGPAVFEELAKFQGAAEQFDDMTLLVLDFTV